MSNANVPPRQGFWWRPGSRYPYADEVCGGSSGLVIYDDGSCLAPVPSPAVCEALATLSERLAEFDALGWTDAADYMRGADEFKAALKAWREVVG